jgi:hypothetical protein
VKFNLTAIAQHNHYIKTDFVPCFVEQGKRVSTVDQSTNFLIRARRTLCQPGRQPFQSPVGAGYDRMAQTWFEGIRALQILPGNLIERAQPP